MHDSCSAKAAANYFLDCAAREGKTLNAIQIQKLVYIAHGWRLALDKKALIEESVEAGPWGPVIPALYDQFKRYGNEPIEERATRTRMLNKGETLTFITETPAIDSECREARRLKPLLDKVWKVYSGFTPVQLANMTHQEGSPWDITRKRHPGKRSASIPDSTIQAHFEKQARPSRSGQAA